MDTQLKHRLTGAVIFVALVVVLVPEMLSGPRAPSNAPPGEPLELPTSGMAPVAPVRSVDIDLGEPSPAASSAAPASAPAPAAAAPASTAAASASAPVGAAAPMSTAAPAAAPASAAPSVAPATTPGRQGAAAAPASSTPRLPLEGRFIVQAGSFAARDSAEALAARLRRAGFDVQVSTVQSAGRTLHRVRVGTAADRVAAEALLMRLRAAGHTGSVVAAQ